MLVEVPHRHRRGGRHFDIRIEMTVAGGAPIIVSHAPSLHGGSKELEQEALTKESKIEGERRYAEVAIHEAFDAARRQLEDFAREQRDVMKQHAVGPVSPVVARRRSRSRLRSRLHGRCRVDSFEDLRTFAADTSNRHRDRMKAFD